jgi:hypothetical protein
VDSSPLVAHAGRFLCNGRAARISRGRGWRVGSLCRFHNPKSPKDRQISNPKFCGPIHDGTYQLVGGKLIELEERFDAKVADAEGNIDTKLILTRLP